MKRITIWYKISNIIVIIAATYAIFIIVCVGWDCRWATSMFISNFLFCVCVMLNHKKKLGVHDILFLCFLFFWFCCVFLRVHVKSKKLVQTTKNSIDNNNDHYKGQWVYESTVIMSLLFAKLHHFSKQRN